MTNCPAPTTFDAWMEEVDHILYLNHQVTNLDLPDWDYHDAFDEGRTPAAVIDDVLTNAGMF